MKMYFLGFPWLVGTTTVAIQPRQGEYSSAVATSRKTFIKTLKHFNERGGDRRVGFSPVPPTAHKAPKRPPSTASSSANHNSARARKHSSENDDVFVDETAPLTNAAASSAKVNTSDVKVINSLIEDLSRLDENPKRYSRGESLYSEPTPLLRRTPTSTTHSTAGSFVKKRTNRCGIAALLPSMW